jgi:arsenate reductase
MDTIITVCDNAARETCPVWPGHPATAHWSIDDPAAVEGPEEARVQAFTRAFSEIEGRVRALIDSMQSKDVSR